MERMLTGASDDHRQRWISIDTHPHIDHAGCAQDLKHSGMRLIVIFEQTATLAAMARWIKSGEPFTPIQTAVPSASRRTKSLHAST